MVAKTLTRADLAEAVYHKVGLSRTESNQIIEELMEEMTMTLERGEDLKISSFGSFVLRKKKERIGRNPKTKVEAKITPRRVVVFRASQVMKEEING